MNDSEIPTFQMPSPYPAAGEVIDGKYLIEKILGEGGMGAVMKAMHVIRRAPVALKFMSPAMMSMEGAVERFVNEGVAASQIDSDHVVKVLDVGQMKTGAPYLVMEFLIGCDLAELLAREGRPGIDVPRAVHFVLQTLRGLQVAHTAGIVHRDMKPSNVFVIEKDGEPDFVKLVDFGISKVLQQGAANITRTNSALGTPLYMSPEQARSPRDVDLRTDLYSVSVILYELLTGRTPFVSETGEYTEILFKIFTQDPPHVQTIRPDLPDGLCAAIHRALDRDPKARYASASEMGEAIAPWADGRSSVILQRMKSAGRGPRALGSIAPPTDVTPSVAPIEPSKVGHSVSPPALEARASPDAATAQTMLGAPPQSTFPPPRPKTDGGDTAVSPSGSQPARTDMAASREPSVREERTGKRGLVVAAFIGVFLLAIFGIGTMAAMRARATADTSPSSSATGSALAATGQPSTTNDPRGLPPSDTSSRVTPSATNSDAPPAITAPATASSARPPTTASTAATTSTGTAPQPTTTHKLVNIQPQQ